MNGNDEDKPPEVVIVAYGAPEPLEACMARLDGKFAPVVVDNSSAAATRAVVEAHGGIYIDPGRNLGFGAGVNHALAKLPRPDADVLLLNPDATISPADITRLHARLIDDAHLACVAAEQIDPTDGQSAQIWWPVPTPTGAWLDAFGLGSLGRGRQKFVIGSVLLLRGAAIKDVGSFDERFFLYAEETDWEIRALQRDWTIGSCAEVVATHIGGGTGGDPTGRATHFYASHERLIRKHHGNSGWLVYRSATVVGALARMIVLRGDRRRRARLTLRLHLRGPCVAEQQLR